MKKFWILLSNFIVVCCLVPSQSKDAFSTNSVESDLKIVSTITKSLDPRLHKYMKYFSRKNKEGLVKIIKKNKYKISTIADAVETYIKQKNIEIEKVLEYLGITCPVTLENEAEILSKTSSVLATPEYKIFDMVKRNVLDASLVLKAENKILKITENSLKKSRKINGIFMEKAKIAAINEFKENDNKVLKDITFNVNGKPITAYEALDPSIRYLVMRSGGYNENLSIIYSIAFLLVHATSEKQKQKLLDSFQSKPVNLLIECLKDQISITDLYWSEFSYKLPYSFLKMWDPYKRSEPFTNEEQMLFKTFKELEVFNYEKFFNASGKSRNSINYSSGTKFSTAVDKNIISEIQKSINQVENCENLQTDININDKPAVLFRRVLIKADMDEERVAIRAKTNCNSSSNNYIPPVIFRSKTVNNGVVTKDADTDSCRQLSGSSQQSQELDKSCEGDNVDKTNLQIGVKNKESNLKNKESNVKIKDSNAKNKASSVKKSFSNVSTGSNIDTNKCEESAPVYATVNKVSSKDESGSNVESELNDDSSNVEENIANKEISLQMVKSNSGMKNCKFLSPKEFRKRYSGTALLSKPPRNSGRRYSLYDEKITEKPKLNKHSSLELGNERTDHIIDTPHEILDESSVAECIYDEIDVKRMEGTCVKNSMPASKFNTPSKFDSACKAVKKVAVKGASGIRNMRRSIKGKNKLDLAKLHENMNIEKKTSVTCERFSTFDSYNMIDNTNAFVKNSSTNAPFSTIMEPGGVLKFSVSVFAGMIIGYLIHRAFFSKNSDESALIRGHSLDAD